MKPTYPGQKDPNPDATTKLQLLAVENERLNQVLNEVNLENSNLRNQIAKLAKKDEEQRLLSLIDENKYLQNELEQKNREIDQLRFPPSARSERSNPENYRLASENQKLKEQVTDLERKLALVVKENDRVNMMLSMQYDECEKLKKQLEATTSAGPQGERVNVLLSEIERLNVALADANEELKSLKYGLDDIPEERTRGSRYASPDSKRRSTSDLVARINILVEECEKLTTLLDAQERQNEALRQENEALKSNVPTLNSLNDKIKTLESKCRELIEENTKLNVNLNECSLANEDLRNRMADLTQLNANLQRDHAALSQQLQNKMLQDTQKGSGTQRGDPRDNPANSQISQLIAENKRLSDTLTALQRDHETLSNLVHQIPKLAEENEKLANLLDQSYTQTVETHRFKQVGPRESETLKSQAFDSARRGSDYDTKLRSAAPTDFSSPENALKAALKENEELKNSLREFQKLGGVVDAADKLRQESEALKRALEVKNREIELAKSEAAVLKDTINRKEREAAALSEKIKQLEQANAQYAIDLPRAKQEIEKLRTDFERVNKGYAESQLGSSNLYAQLAQAQRENIALKENNTQLHHKLEEAGNQKVRLEEMRRTIDLLQKEIERLNSIIQQKTREHDGLKEKQAFLLEQVNRNDQNLQEMERLAGLLQLKGQENAMLKAKLDELEKVAGKVRDAETVRKRQAELEDLNMKMLKDNEYMFKAMQELKRELAEKNKEGTGNKDTRQKEQELRQKEEELIMKEKDLKQKEQLLNDTGRTRDTRSGLNDKRSEREVGTLEQEIANLKEENSRLEAKIQELIKENDTIGQAFNEKASELEGLTYRQKMLERSVREPGSPERYKALEEEIHKLKETVDETEKTNQRLIEENNQLKAKVMSTVSEVQEWKNKYQSLEVQREQELEQIKEQFAALEGANMGGGTLKAQLAAYEAQLSQVNQILEDQDNQLKNLLSENERITALSVERLRQVEEWRRKYLELEDRFKLENGELKAQVELLKANQYDVKQFAIRYSAEKASDQNQINQLKQMNNNYREELEKVYELMGQRKAEYTKLTNEYEALVKAFEKAQAQLKASGTGQLGGSADAQKESN